MMLKVSSGTSWLLYDKIESFKVEKIRSSHMFDWDSEEDDDDTLKETYTLRVKGTSAKVEFQLKFSDDRRCRATKEGYLSSSSLPDLKFKDLSKVLVRALNVGYSTKDKLEDNLCGQVEDLVAPHLEGYELVNFKRSRGTSSLKVTAQHKEQGPLVFIIAQESYILNDEGKTLEVLK